MSISYSIIDDQCIQKHSQTIVQPSVQQACACYSFFIKMRSGISLLFFTRKLESFLHSTQEETCRIHKTSSVQLKNFVTLTHDSTRRKNFKICYPNAIFLRTSKIKALYQKVCQNDNDYNMQDPHPPFFSSSSSSIPLALVTQSRQDPDTSQNA